MYFTDIISKEMSVSRAEEVYQRLQLIAACSERPDCLFRPYGSISSKQVRILVEQWLSAIKGVSVQTDALLNIQGRLPGKI